MLRFQNQMRSMRLYLPFSQQEQWSRVKTIGFQGERPAVPVSVHVCILTAFQWGVLCFYRSKFQGEKVPTLREAVVESMDHNLLIYFDVKGHANQVLLTVLGQLPSPFLWDSNLLFCWSQTGMYGTVSSIVWARLCLWFVSSKVGCQSKDIPSSHSIVLGSCNLKLARDLCECWVQLPAAPWNKAQRVPCLCSGELVSHLQPPARDPPCL